MQNIMEDYVILDLYWDQQQIKKNDGTILWVTRGKDYDLDWVKMGDSFAKYKKNIFLYDNYCFQKLKKIIDFESFTLFKSNKNNIHYFKDKSNVYLRNYYFEYILEDANPDTFKILDLENGLATDGTNDYILDVKIPFELAKAKIISEFYLRIGNDIYCNYQEKLNGVDAESFKIIRDNLSKDKNHVYFKSKIVDGADAETFEILQGCINADYYEGMHHTFYAKDKTKGYFIDATDKNIKPLKIKNVDEFRFEVIIEVGYAIDMENKYYYGKKVKK